jgi:hypothetical protein
VRVRGELESCLAIDDHRCLKKLVDIFASFKVPKEAVVLSQKLGLKLPTITASWEQLKRSLLEPNWRQWPMQFDLPSNSQFFGQIVWDAGIEGIRYPSTKTGAPCLAVYPQHFETSSAVVEIIDPGPHKARCLAWR